VSELVLAPRLARGTHEIAMWVMDEYSIGQPDTVFRTIRARVADELTILNLYNYPNPFSSGTSFTFSLSGSRSPDGGKISVYTVAGRRVLRRELNDLRVGFNRVEWDGRDDDGDEIANGTYLYRLEVRAGQETQVAGGKLARVR
jgi:flagellar hook assembly protein FlgD